METITDLPGKKYDLWRSIKRDIYIFNIGQIIKIDQRHKEILLM